MDPAVAALDIANTVKAAFENHEELIEVNAAAAATVPANIARNTFVLGLELEERRKWNAGAHASCSASPPPHATLASRRLARTYLGRTCTG